MNFSKFEICSLWSRILSRILNSIRCLGLYHIVLKTYITKNSIIAAYIILINLLKTSNDLSNKTNQTTNIVNI